MSYTALYRKFRPGTFDQVKGQDHVVHTLKNQLINGRIGHAYLFTGTRGTGKTSVAKILAKAVNCLHPVDGEPCNECENCRAINAGSFVDVAEVDAASNNGVDDIRRIIEDVRYTPVKGKYKVFIIDEAHMITGPAFNAFLKTLEEPPAYAVFILATTEPYKLPVTILSRCQRYDFRRIQTGQIAGNLASIISQEGVEADEKALAMIARAGDGSMRDAVSLLDKCIAFNLGEKLTYEAVLDTLGTVDTEVFSGLFRSIYEGNTKESLLTIEKAVEDGKDLTQFVSDFIWYIRNVLMVKAADIKDPFVLGISEENMALVTKDAKHSEPSVLMRYIRILSDLISRLRYSSEKQVLLEIGVIRLSKPEMETDADSLADRIRMLERRISSGIPEPSAAVKERGPETAAKMPETNVQAPLEMAPEAVLQGFEAAPESSPEGERSPRITGLWQNILSSCHNPRVRVVLNKCSGNEETPGQLLIFAPNDFVLKQLEEESVKETISQLIREITGSSMQIITKLQTGKPLKAQPSPEKGFPDELLNAINFNIGTEEW